MFINLKVKGLRMIGPRSASYAMRNSKITWIRKLFNCLVQVNMCFTSNVCRNGSKEMIFALCAESLFWMALKESKGNKNSNQEVK